jgi:hypothetical protein
MHEAIQRIQTFIDSYCCLPLFVLVAKTSIKKESPSKPIP